MSFIIFIITVLSMIPTAAAATTIGDSSLKSFVPFSGVNWVLWTIKFLAVLRSHKPFWCITIDRLQAAGLCSLLQQERMAELIEGTGYLVRSMTVLEYVALMLDSYLPLSDTALDIALGLRTSDRSKFFNTGVFKLTIMATQRTYVISEGIRLLMAWKCIRSCGEAS